MIAAVIFKTEAEDTLFKKYVYDRGLRASY